ncbi:phage major capsid protein [Corynebacterium pseudopelargi]|uniref:Phage capsid family protein n=1 Tax=Corynebacterium pseudopelargi TaxID=2080757 RepID=A0A3G6IVG3_9CORY|nr:phage major capsid protein [Corynebacterium pseudopelargi]AZA08638.1 Phage capsid family protein [Corynebacterium pseudopelargi]
MTGITTKTTPALVPEERVNEVLILPIEQGLAGRISTIHRTMDNAVHFPKVSEDPAASWVEEGEEIAPSAPTIGEIVVTPAKVAGLTVISREMIEDSDSPVSQIVGQALVRDIGAKIDAAYFGSVDAPAPDGLETITPTEVSAGSAWANLDPFAEAVSTATQRGATITTFVANPADALALATLKKQKTSNEPLLAADPTQPARSMLNGVPLETSKYVTPGTVWGIPRDRVYMVIGREATIDVSDAPFFTSDRIAVRATMRAGFGFIDEASIVRIKLAG